MSTKSKAVAPVTSGPASTAITSGHVSQTSSLRGTDATPLPKTVRIFGKDITIDYVKLVPGPDEGTVSGEMCEETLSIKIQPGQLPIEEMDTLLHETIHALDYILSLGLTEHQVRMLGTGLVGLFQDNPEFTYFVTRPMPSSTILKR